MSTPGEPAEIGIIGGTGFYSFLRDAERVPVQTPFGAPSAEVSIGEVARRRVAFLPRHGDSHQFAPHRVNYRANLWALRSLGVRQVLAPCAVGSLKPELGPGTFVVPDQVVDRTWGRPHTVYDMEGPVVHVAFADPYCQPGRAAVLDAATAAEPLVDGGTLVVINGPRFSSKAESAWHAAQGWSLVGMTGQPESAVARELALCYTAIAMVTDHDAGVGGESAVTHADVLQIFASNLERLRDLLWRAVERLPATEPDESAPCTCRRVLDGLDLPFALP
jgi:5'-methylthioadenosine phosphorylase